MARIHPVIIQGGMGAGVSNWRLANAVSKLGQLGVVSGTALDHILARRLQDGDPGGHMRRALDRFPYRKMAQRIWEDFYVAGGRSEAESYKVLPKHLKDSPREIVELCIVSNFVEVFLAREGHENPVGINYLDKIQIPHLPSIYGAMLAGVAYVLMGAGIPLRIPGVLDNFVTHQPATYELQVTGAQSGDDTTMHFAPQEFMEHDLPPLQRPYFLSIVASNVLAATMLKRANGRVDGFIVEGPTAGGHNAPPRGKKQLSDLHEPIYGERDVVDLVKMKELGMPFWLAGGYGSAAKLHEALGAGATGIQVGTAFAFCKESGLREDYKHALLKKAIAGKTTVFTDPSASPTGYPFKAAQLEGTLSEPEVYEARARICDLGYLREAYRSPEGTIEYRCAAEPLSVYLSKGGQQESTVARKCLCNALMANIGLQQVRAGKYEEGGLVTVGDDLTEIPCFLPADRQAYSAADVIAKLLAA